MPVTKLISRLLGSTLLLLRSQLSWSQNDDIVGLWQDADHPAKMIRIYREGVQYAGKSVEREKEAMREGKLVFRELKWNAGKNHWAGTLLNPNGNGTFPVAVRLEGNNNLRFRAGSGLLSRQFNFKRVVK